MPLKIITALIFFLSGASTLIYQVVWQRVLTQEIGVDFVSLAIIVTIFMIGLGFGALGGGFISSRYKRELPYVYAGIEAVIGLYGIISLFLIRSVNGLANNVLGTQSVMFDFIVNGLVLVGPIFLMGITTPVIIEFMKTRLERVGSIVGIFYGINVLGAAAGALMTGIFFIELYGLYNTSLIAAALNLICSIGFLAALWFLPRDEVATVAAPASDAKSLQHIISLAGVPRRILVASFLFGFVTLSMEMALFRVISNYFTPWPPLFAFMLAVFLLMLAIGEFIAGVVVDRIKQSQIWLLLMALFLGSVASTLVLLYVPLTFIHDTLKITQFAVYNKPYDALLLIAAFMVPILFVAGFLPVVVKLATKDIADVGATFAAILFTFTLGNIFGSYLTAIWFFEWFGTLGSLSMAMTMTAIGVYLIYYRDSFELRTYIAGAGAVTIALLLVLTPWDYFLQSNGYLRAHFKSLGLKGAAADVKPIEVMEDREAVTVIVPDRHIHHVRPFWGNSALTTTDARVGINVWSLSHLMAIDPGFKPKRILQIGTGGAQFAFAMKEWSFVEKVTVVELNASVLQAHKKYSHPLIGGLIDNKHPKVEYVHNDGRRYVQKALARGEKFDLVQIGVNNLKQVGTNNIYSFEFLSKVKKLVRPTGYVALFSYTGLARLGLELWDKAFIFPDARNWVMLTDKGFPANNSKLGVSEQVARFYMSGDLEQLKREAPAELPKLRVNIYGLSEFFKPYEISTDDNLTYEYWMLRTRRKANNNPEVYLWNHKNVPHEQRTYELCVVGRDGCPKSLVGTPPDRERAEMKSGAGGGSPSKAGLGPAGGPRKTKALPGKRADAGPAITPFTEALQAESVFRFSLFEFDPKYVDRLISRIDAKAKERQGSKYQMPFAKDLVVPSSRVGFTLKSNASYKYHSVIVGKSGLPLVRLEDAQSVSVRLRFRVNNYGRIYWSLIWCDEDGNALPNLDIYYLRIMIGQGKRGAPINEVFEHIPVPVGAKSLRINPAFARAFDFKLESLEVVGHKGRIEPATPEQARVNRTQGNGSLVHAVQFEPWLGAAESAPRLGRGIEFELAGIADTHVLDGRHQIQSLRKLGGFMLINRFGCAQLIAARSDGSRISVRFDGADTLHAFQRGDRLFVRAYQYEFRERLFETLAPNPDARGVYRNRNLGVTRRMPAARMAVKVSDGADFFFCPVWQPEGRLATFVFTEHADLLSYAHMRQLLFGNAEGKRVDGQGLVGNNIPLTTTVFAFGPDRDIEILDETYREEPLENAPALRDLLLKLRADGFPIEIGLHTPSTGQDNVDSVKRALRLMAPFKTKVWIDHALIGNLEALSRFGWMRTNKEHYIIPSLREHGYKLAWSSTDKYFSRLNLIRDGVTANLLYYVPELDDDLSDAWRLQLFGAVQTQLPRIKKEQIEQLIYERGVSIIHIYLALYSITNENLNEKANKVLQLLADSRDRGELHLATLSDWVGYANSVREVDVAAGQDRVTVRSSKNLGKATFVLRALGDTPITELVVKDEADVAARSVDGATYVWFDLVAEEPFEVAWRVRAN